MSLAFTLAPPVMINSSEENGIKCLLVYIPKLKRLSRSKQKNERTTSPDILVIILICWEQLELLGLPRSYFRLRNFHHNYTLLNFYANGQTAPFNNFGLISIRHIKMTQNLIFCEKILSYCKPAISVKPLNEARCKGVLFSASETLAVVDLFSKFSTSS